MSLVEAGDDGHVVVDDPVDDRVQRGAGTAAQEIGTRLHAQTHVVQRRFTVPHGDDEALADEEEDLAELDDSRSGR